MLVDCRILKSSYLNICSRKSAETSNWSLNSHQPPVRVAERAAFAGNQCPKAPDIVVWVARHGSTKHYLRLKSNSTLSRFNFIRWFALVNRFWKKKLVNILSSIPAQANTSHIIWLSTEWGSLPHWVKITLCLCVCVCLSFCHAVEKIALLLVTRPPSPIAWPNCATSCSRDVGKRPSFRDEQQTRGVI